MFLISKLYYNAKGMPDDHEATMKILRANDVL